MNQLKQAILGLSLMLGLCGCIKQDVEIKIEADGSGTIVCKTNINDIHSVLSYAKKSDGEKATFKHLALDEKTEIIDGKKWRISTYSFKKLGKALPELEHEIPMMPRFSERNDKFVMFLSRERGEHEGFKIDNKEIEDCFYNLAVTFPTSPTSKTGTISGNTVRWSFDNANIKEIKEKNIGELILKAEVALSAIKADIQPHLVGEPVRTSRSGSKMSKLKDTRLEEYSATIPIHGDNFNYKPNAKVTLNYPINSITVPFAYKELSVKSLIIDKNEYSATIKGKPDGVFTGKDQWGRKTEGLPVTFSFQSNNPWPNVINTAAISVKVEEATKTSLKEVLVTEKSLKQLQVIDNSMNISVASVELGSNKAAYPEAAITFATNLTQTDVLAVYLDTDYGLRYKTATRKWDKKKIENIYDNATKAAASFFKENGNDVFIGQLTTLKMPPPPFKLIFELIEKKEVVEKIITMETINVTK